MLGWSSTSGRADRQVPGQSPCRRASCSSWACFISFSMGSTFGTFGLDLLIAAGIVASVPTSLALDSRLRRRTSGCHLGTIRPRYPTPRSRPPSGRAYSLSITQRHNSHTRSYACDSILDRFHRAWVHQEHPVGLLTTLAALAVAVFVLRIRFGSESARESEVERLGLPIKRYSTGTFF